jgi:hypothetical protein
MHRDPNAATLVASALGGVRWFTCLFGVLPTPGTFAAEPALSRVHTTLGVRERGGPVAEPIYVFWALIALLALAAGCNHRWHHARHSHLDARLVRAACRNLETVPLRAEPKVGTARVGMSRESDPRRVPGDVPGPVELLSAETIADRSGCPVAVGA